MLIREAQCDDLTGLRRLYAKLNLGGSLVKDGLDTEEFQRIDWLKAGIAAQFYETCGLSANDKFAFIARST